MTNRIVQLPKKIREKIKLPHNPETEGIETLELSNIKEVVLRRRDNKKFLQHALNTLRVSGRINDASELFELFEKEKMVDSKINGTGIRIALDEGNIEKARKRYENAMEQEETDSIVHGTMIEAYIVRKEEQRALEILENAKDLGEDSPAHYSIILRSKNGGKFKEIQKFFREIPQEKRDEKTYEQMTRLCIRFNKIDEGCKIINEAIQRNMASKGACETFERETRKRGVKAEFLEERNIYIVVMSI